MMSPHFLAPLLFPWPSEDAGYHIRPSAEDGGTAIGSHRLDERPSSLCREHRRKGLAVGARRTLIFHDAGGLVGKRAMIGANPPPIAAET